VCQLLLAALRRKIVTNRQKFAGSLSK